VKSELSFNFFSEVDLLDLDLSILQESKVGLGEFELRFERKLNQRSKPALTI
jgi:hypothetical protein